jgi:hypothetical protein
MMNVTIPKHANVKIVKVIVRIIPLNLKTIANHLNVKMEKMVKMVNLGLVEQ